MAQKRKTKADLQKEILILKSFQEETIAALKGHESLSDFVKAKTNEAAVAKSNATRANNKLKSAISEVEELKQFCNVSSKKLVDLEKEINKLNHLNSGLQTNRDLLSGQITLLEAALIEKEEEGLFTFLRSYLSNMYSKLGPVKSYTFYIIFTICYLCMAYFFSKGLNAHALELTNNIVLSRTFAFLSYTTWVVFYISVLGVLRRWWLTQLK